MVKGKRVSYTNQVYAYVIVLLLYVDLVVELGSEDKGKNKKGIFFVPLICIIKYICYRLTYKCLNITKIPYPDS